MFFLYSYIFKEVIESGLFAAQNQFLFDFVAVWHWHFVCYIPI